MTGQHLNDLKHRVTGMSRADVRTSQTAWSDNAESLQNVATRLDDAGKRMKLGFGDTEIALAAEQAFTDAATKIRKRRKEMHDAAAALDLVADAMREAEAAARQAPPEPGEKPQVPPGSGEDIDDITALKIYAGKMRLYNTRSTAYGDADADARVKVQALIDNYNDAVEVLGRIESPVDTPGPRNPGPGGPTGPGPSPIPTGTGRPPLGPIYTGHPIDPTVPIDPTIPVQPEHPIGPVGPGYPIVDEGPGLTPTPVGPGGPNGPVGPGGPGGVNPAVLGGLAGAGLLGGPGLANGIRGLLSRGGLGSPGAIGSSSRAGGPGSLGRTGATPGSPVSRGGSGRGGGGGGRGGVAGNPGGRGGRGGQGGRGTAGAGTGGRGKKRDREEGRDRDLFDDGQDWIDDEGAGPGLLD